MVNSLAVGPPPEVLISFRNCGEAVPLIGEDVAVFDLKEPDRGSLGRPDRETVRRFGVELAKLISAGKTTGSTKLSVALGEAFEEGGKALELLTSADWLAALQPYDYIKVGLSSAKLIPGWKQRWNDAYRRFASFAQLVPVAYADSMNCDGPSIDEVLEMAIEVREDSRRRNDRPFAMLIDTFDKTAGGLFSHLQPRQLFEWNSRAEQHGVRIGVAGSLSLKDLEQLRFAKAELIGLRGAVCVREQRTKAVDIRLVREFLSGVKRPREDK